MEWGRLALCILAGAVFLFLPGSLVSCSLSRGRAMGIALGPAISIFLYCLISIVFESFNVPQTWASLFIPALICGVLFLGICMRMRKTSVPISEYDDDASDASAPLPLPEAFRHFLRNDEALLVVYVFFGALFTWLVFLQNIPNPSAFTTGIDNLTHLGYIESFLNTGNWSFFGTNIYDGEGYLPPSGSLSHGFYPSTWHFIATMIADATGVGAPEAANACSAVFTAFVLPTGMLALLRKLFPDNPLAALFGALVCVGFPNMPWKLLSAGPVYPNMASLCMAPAVMALFISCTANGLSKRARFIRFGLLCVSVFSITLTQTNVIFTLMVFLVPYCVHKIFHWPFLEKKAHGSILKLSACLAFVGAFIGVWVFLYNSPALSSIVSFHWPSYQSVPHAIWSYLTLSYWNTLKQASMAVLVLVGFVWALKRNETRWISVSYGIMAVIYVLSSATDGAAKHFLAGFWYTDPMRISANAALFAMPLAALGLSALCRMLGTLVAKVSDLRRRNRYCAIIDCAMAVFLLVALLIPNRFYTGHPEDCSPLNWVALGIAIDYSNEEGAVYDSSEREFVEKVREIVGNDALIINDPVDGSTYAYGVDGLNVFYRYFSDSEGTDESDAIRLRLKDISDDADVRAAINELKAQYVLLLDQPTNQEGVSTLSPFTSRDEWGGIDGVTDETPGFELVLAENDMRLYRIMPEGEGAPE